MATSFFYIYVMATIFFYIYVMATSFFYMYVMATSFFYIYIYKLTERSIESHFFFESNEPLPPLPLHCTSCLRIDRVMIFSRSHSDQELLQKFVWPWAQHSVIKHNICLLVWQKHIFAVDAA